MLSLFLCFFAATLSKLALMRSQTPVCCFFFSFSPESILLRHCPLQGRSRALLVF